MKLDIKKLTQIPKTNSFKPYTLSPEQYEQLKHEAGYSPPFYLSDDMLCLIDINENEKKESISLIPISTYIKVVERQRNIATDEYTYLVVIRIKGVPTELILKGEELITLNFKNLMAYGFLFEEQYARFLQKYLVQSANEAPTKIVHSTLGWIDENTYLSNNVYSINDVQSEYIGKTDFAPKGSSEAYINLINTNVLEYTPLLFVWLLGFASAILSYLNQYLDIGCLLIGLNNLSSKGKTTAAMLTTSVTSNPIFDRGLMSNFSGTSNAILGYVSLFNGHTVVLDEAATNEAKNTRKLLYQLCSGRERKRLDTSGELKYTAEFSSIVLITGEFSIIDETASNGIRARVFEITDDLTDSAEHSNIIKQTVLANYGLLYDDFLKYLIGCLDDVLDDYNRLVQVLKNGFQGVKGELTDRVLEKLAVIYLTAYYVKDCFNLDIDLGKIKKYIYKLEANVNNEADISEKAFETVMQYVCKHSGKFAYGQEGKITPRGSNYEIAILKTVVEDILKTNNFENNKVIYNKWSQKGYLLSEKDRPYKRMVISNDLPKQACFVFNLKNDNTNPYKNLVRENIIVIESKSSDNLDDVDIEFK